jgi:aerobic C4-dicarboxylate transport protein
MGDLKKVGRVGGIALLYFEIVTTLALAIGLLVANVVRPGAGIATQSATLAATTQYSQEAQKHSISEFLLNIIPDNIVNAFAKGDLLQILLFSVLFGLAVAALGPRAAGLVRGMERLSDVMFRVVALIMKVAPLGALGAMAYTIGKFGIGSLVPLAKLMGCVYLTMLLFIFVVLGSAARLFGFSLLRYLAFIKEEILLVLGTSSSESALPRMIERLEQLGCGRAVVGMVIPAGYSFNLDGTSIYLSMAVLFIAQAFGIELSFWQQIYLMAILMLTSKGAAAVTGGGFVTLAATLQATHVLPVEGLALLLGVDRFMSEARAITNLIGNGVATICVSKMEGEFDEARYRAAVSGQPAELPTLPAEITA